MHQPRLLVSWLSFTRTGFVCLYAKDVPFFSQVQKIARVVRTGTVQPARCCISTNRTGWTKSTDSATRPRGGQSLDKSRQVRTAQIRHRLLRLVWIKMRICLGFFFFFLGLNSRRDDESSGSISNN